VDAGIDQFRAPVSLYCFIGNTKSHVVDGAHPHLSAFDLRLVQSFPGRAICG